MFHSQLNHKLNSWPSSTTQIAFVLEQGKRDVTVRISRGGVINGDGLIVMTASFFIQWRLTSSSSSYFKSNDDLSSLKMMEIEQILNDTMTLPNINNGNPLRHNDDLCYHPIIILLEVKKWRRPLLGCIFRGINNSRGFAMLFFQVP